MVSKTTYERVSGVVKGRITLGPCDWAGIKKRETSNRKKAEGVKRLRIWKLIPVLKI